LSNKHIRITVIDENNQILNSKIYKYKRKSESIILKNKNIKPLIIPYLAGALDITRLNIKSDDYKNLFVMIYQHRSGGAFLIPMGWSNTNTIEKYKRIK